MISYGRQHIDGDDIDAVVQVLRSDWLTQGPAVKAFERSFSAAVGAEHAIAVSSATAGLHVSCLALGLKENEYLWTTPNSFVASANCALYCGANVEFVDINPVTRNLCPDKLTEQLAIASAKSVLPKILVVVHFAGLPCDLAKIRELTNYYGVYLIEDAAHAVGSQYNESPIGSGLHSDITVFSFHPVKTLAAGEGGIVVTNDVTLATKISQLTNHGVERNAENFITGGSSPCYYEQQLLGFNYRMSDIHAALALSQLNKLTSFVEARRHLVERYNQALKNTALQLPVEPEGYFSAWHIYVVTFTSLSQRNHCYELLRANNIFTNVHYIPIHKHPYYYHLNRQFGSDFPSAEHHYECALTLPLYVDLSEADQDKIIRLVKEVV